MGARLHCMVAEGVSRARSRTYVSDDPCWKEAVWHCRILTRDDLQVAHGGEKSVVMPDSLQQVWEQDLARLMLSPTWALVPQVGSRTVQALAEGHATDELAYWMGIHDQQRIASSRARWTRVGLEELALYVPGLLLPRY